MTEKCWICGDPAGSREHRTKRSDLKSIAGEPTQTDPLFLHTAKKRNRRIGSLNADALKFSSRLCHFCNTTRTQPHDYAWQIFSESLRFRQPRMVAGQFIRANTIFPYNTRHAMRHVQLYIVKLFGCMITDGNVTIDIKSFADAIMRDRLHPNVYFAVGPAPKDEEKIIAGASDLQLAMLDGKPAFAVWIHHVGNLWVRVMYAADGERRQGLEGTWHPRRGDKGITMANFE